jgi:hypothetical protein
MRRKTIFIALLSAIAVIQIFQINKTNKPIDPSLDFFTVYNSPYTTQIKDACYDCHSNQVEFPWYTYIQPVGWWVNGHIKNGKKKVNYSNWKNYTFERQQEILQESAEVIEQKRMPLKSFVWMHPEAKLSEQDRSNLANWFNQIKE